ncbi:chorismate mutase [Enterobacteriaceae bacterium BIT-l23]|uniref:chorismate mutase n=1 Tax=Jejubacter sp. L23 TaxID=3092086 RepID=UPI00158577BF|nr:chorismate mutase [Enterobacteriaceae bacterium BIT-l23]
MFLTRLPPSLILLTVTALPLSAMADASVAALINDRLSFMKDVAGDKARHHLAIEDLAQEKRVLEKSVAEARAMGLDGASVATFIQAQMDAAKAIQYRYRADWLAAPESGWSPRPLAEIREKIAQLSQRILAQTAERLKSGQPLSDAEKAQFIHTLAQKNLSESDKQRLWQTLKQVRLASQ